MNTRALKLSAIAGALAAGESLGGMSARDVDFVRARLDRKAARASHPLASDRIAAAQAKRDRKAERRRLASLTPFERSRARNRRGAR